MCLVEHVFECWKRLCRRRAAASPGAACRARLRSRRSRRPWAHNLWRGELVSGVHTLVWRSVQVYHELEELEEQDKGREEVQEIEKESQVEENHSHGYDYGDDLKDQHLSPGARADDVTLWTRRT